MDQSEALGEQASGATRVATSFLADIQSASDNPEELERLFQRARAAKEVSQFTNDIVAAHQAAPTNLLYAAWYYRLGQGAGEVYTARSSLANWKLAIPLAIVLGLVFWALSGPEMSFGHGNIYVFFLWGPLAALFILAFLTLTARRHYGRAAFLAADLALCVGYLFIFAPLHAADSRSPFLLLALAHLPLLAWGAVGISVLGARFTAKNLFAFLTKSVEVIGTAGVYTIAGGIFVAITEAMFLTLGVSIPEPVQRLLLLGGAGLIPVIAVASVYDPTLSPIEQDFRRGFGKILAIIMRLLLPLTLVTLVIYSAFIPFNFDQPFVDRDVLIIYNVMLFAIIGLLVGVTPISADDLPARWATPLRVGIALVAGLVALISCYALAAALYRTFQGQLTANRLTIIGWNIINIAILILLLVGQLRASKGAWIAALHTTFRNAAVAYLFWALVVTFLIPNVLTQ